MKESTYLKPGVKRYLANYLAIALTMLGSFASYRLCFHFYGEDALEMYAVSRRMLSYGIAFVASGLGVSLCYHVAEDHSKDQHQGKLWLWAAGLPLLLLLMALLAFTVLFPGTVGLWLFGDEKRGYIALPLLALFISVAVQILVGYFFSGRMEIVKSSSLTAVCSGVIPIVSFFLFPGSLVSFFWGTGVLGLASSALFYFFYIRPDLENDSIDGGKLQDAMNLVLSYAATRVPGGFLIAVIINLPVSFATHASHELTAAAAIAIGVALVELVAAGVTPLSNIYLPQTAYLAARGKVHELMASSVRVFFFILVTSVAYAVALTLYTEEFLAVFLGSSKLGYAPYVKAVLPAAPFYAFFRCFRGFIDGVSRRALTTYNTLLSLGVFLIVLGASSQPSLAGAASTSLVYSIASLGLLTLAQTYWFLTRNSASDGIKLSEEQQ